MVSCEYILKNPDEDHLFIPRQAELAALQMGLDEKAVMRIRLLAEELICMLPQLLILDRNK